jgi:hypothetical protein
MERIWTHAQFNEMSWHDNHVHALRIVEGVHGSGQLVLDLDYILEWLCGNPGEQRFRIVPVSLTFNDVFALRLALDYASPTAAFGPFSIGSIERRVESRPRYEATIWRILINWPVGEISFEASGYEQRGIGGEVLCSEQYLSAERRRL